MEQNNELTRFCSRYAVRTDSLNLFFCFRWILIAFKREFKFEDVIRLWDVSVEVLERCSALDRKLATKLNTQQLPQILFTSYYSEEYVLFIALAILHSHREVIIRYLIEFDEVLKYANDLSGTVSETPFTHRKRDANFSTSC